MRLPSKHFWWLLGLLVGARLLAMAIVPLFDTSEPRYADIARVMAMSGDWITPWFSPGVPFWGKPPLAFWSEALSIRLFGISEFAARLPSLVVTLAGAWLVFCYGRARFGLQVARWAVLICCSSALVYVASGAVLLDPFLALATTGMMVGTAMFFMQPHSLWRYSPFVFAAVGLLAKGPLAIVLALGALGPWGLLMVVTGRKQEVLRLTRLPWLTGTLLMLLLSVPWYVLAELKTPGFLHYFIVGEHFQRFLDPGWSGDLYGNGHKQPQGTIWLYALGACFPWSLVALGLAIKSLSKGSTGSRGVGWQWILHEDNSYLLAWTLAPLLFFTLAANILWTYALPAVAGFSILLANALVNRQGINGNGRIGMLGLRGAVLLPATLMIMITLISGYHLMPLKTEKDLVAAVQQQVANDQRFFYAEHKPFSANFYSQGAAQLISLEQLQVMRSQGAQAFVAIPRHHFTRYEEALDIELPRLMENRSYVLTLLKGRAQVDQRTVEKELSPNKAAQGDDLDV